MADLEELTRYVESRPDDHDQRWHLAKKLYMAGEYRLALGHLLVLQTNWTPKVNVLRYLAATYYRLERYDEAIAELRTGIEEWPEEIQLREQLAHALEAAGRKDEAIDAWRDLVREKPNHTTAHRALARLAEKPSEATQPPPPPPVPRDSDFGLFQGQACPECGAQNSEEFDRCWKCHAPLLDTGFSKAASPAKPARAPKPAAETVLNTWYIIAAVAACLLLAFGAYLSAQQWTFLRGATTRAPTYGTVREVLYTALFSTRLVLGLVLLVGWPAAMWGAAAIVRPGGVPARASLTTGALLACAAYLILWRPCDEWIWLFLLLQGAALLIILPTFTVKPGKAILVWLLQGIAACCIVLVATAALEGTVLVVEFPAIAKYAGEHDRAQPGIADAGRVVLPPVRVPMETTIQWDSTGSTWLDSRANQALFEITSGKPSAFLNVELKDSSGTQFYDRVNTAPFSFVYDRLLPGHPYTLLLTGDENTKVDIAVRSLFTPHFGSR